jgi:virginiamycin B lyase
MQELRVNSASIRFALLPLLLAATSAWSQQPEFPSKTGVQIPAIQHSMDNLRKTATIAVKGDPDWLAVADDAMWITSGNVNQVLRLDPKTNKVSTVVNVDKPCSGVAIGSGSLWIPSCGDHALLRVDQKTGSIQARIVATPADDEGGIACGAGSVWLVTSAAGELTRVDAATNQVAARITIPAGSFNPLFAEGSIWVTSNAGNSLLRIDPATNKVLGSTAIGPQPRFLAAGAGSIWVLNQGDGTVSRVDAHTGKLLATLPAGIPGHGGEIAFGGGFVWVTETEFPLTQIDPRTNKVVGQWHGDGGDSVRFAFGTVWLTNLKGEKVWRIPLPAQ